MLSSKQPLLTETIDHQWPLTSQKEPTRHHDALMEAHDTSNKVVLSKNQT